MSLSDKYKLLIPALTGNTSNPKFIISATSDAWNGNGWWKAFNGTNKNNTDCWHSGDANSLQSIKVTFDEYHYLCGMFFWQRTSESYPSAGVNINVYSSDDDSTWQLVTTFKNPSTNKKIEVEFPSIVKCKYIKVESSKTGYFTIGELNFYYTKVIMLKSNDSYYSIREEYYDTLTQMYTPVSVLDFKNQNFTTNTLFEGITIGEETFRPIDKFISFDKIQVIQEYNYQFQIQGIKIKSELIVANGDIDLTVASFINSFSIKANETNSKIRIAISIDKGNTWNTYSNGALNPLNINIPLKTYETMTDEEKISYNEAKIEILANGISTETFNSIIFNELFNDVECVRFAYAIEIEDTKSIGEIDDLSWNFDTMGNMRKMTDSEFIVDKYKKTITITSLIDTDILETDIIV